MSVYLLAVRESSASSAGVAGAEGVGWRTEKLPRRVFTAAAMRAHSSQASRSAARTPLAAATNAAASTGQGSCERKRSIAAAARRSAAEAWNNRSAAARAVEG